MRKLITTVFAIALSVGIFAQQSDTMFVHTTDLFIHEFPTAKIDSIIFQRTQPPMTLPKDTVVMTDTVIQIQFDTVTLTDTITQIQFDTVTLTDTVIQIQFDTVTLTDTIIQTQFDTIHTIDTLIINLTDTTLINTLQKKIDSLQTELKIANGTLVRDIDGNIYRTVTIGNQVWMAENLRVTRWNCGTEILHVQDSLQWRRMHVQQGNDWIAPPMFCFADTSIDGKIRYGALYNWFVIDPDNGKQLCPPGWRVPSINDFYILRDRLIADGFNFDGTTTENRIGKAMAVADGWQHSSREGAVGNPDFPEMRNLSGFSAVNSGLRTFTGRFLRGANIWWTSEPARRPPPAVSLGGMAPRVHYNAVDLFICPFGWPIDDAISIRCIRN